ncbi:TPM domain-containing protein [Croceicoccus mobilis]|uniref:TPM domain-containing protein n=1 Tax=Croceicoccus mobilis TaxID=1703339 RepID=A0A917DY54_9SPHN|nr:TPM domain-containing protein [Croceicoccus mobilis]GGD77867.1 hypothetical protein GCM10010990_29540 [Croceicoccus mobilis]
MTRTVQMLAAAMLAMLAILLPAAAHAQDFPELTGRVVDDAGLLSPTQEQALTQKLAALETQSNRQLVVATVPSLQGYNIEDYGYQLGRTWGIGQSEENNGVLLIVAPNERKVRIEVGYGLEPIITDGLSFLIINQQILPRFKQGDMAGGIIAGTQSLIDQLQLPPEEAQKIAAAADTQAREARSGDGIGVFEIIFLLFFLVFFVLPILRGLTGSRRYRRGGVPVIIWGGGGWGGGHGGGGFGGGGFGGGGGFSGGGGSFGGGGASGSW